MDLRELENGVNPDNHWYYQSKIQPLIAYTRKVLQKVPSLTIIDVGSGSGFFAINLEKAFGDKIKKVCLVDINYTPEEIAATKGKKIEKMLYIPERIENSLVVMMDVLEHLEDDLKMLQDIKANSVPASNHFFITVPAFYSLWSNHDVSLGHYRRYKIDTLNKVLNEAKYNIKNTYYLYGSLFPMIWTFRKLDNLRKNKDTSKSNMQSFSPVVNKILYSISSLDMKVASMNKMFGVTCLAEGMI
ncbi:class I SAM-dependent methyltransferase [Nemorincola caseinilytica]|uniref:Class I SAM-dependent methyltransferase n=1 Tax=Nemorincola caseinilytica TaxID=2054315 RepID=A0ABP8N5B0_9BACT